MTTAQCGDTDLHLPHDTCPGLDGTETDPGKPPRPDIDPYHVPETVPGWDRIVLDPDGRAVCGWTDAGDFHAYASVEAIANVLIDTLQEIATP